MMEDDVKIVQQGVDDADEELEGTAHLPKADESPQIQTDKAKG